MYGMVHKKNYYRKQTEWASSALIQRSDIVNLLGLEKKKHKILAMREMTQYYLVEWSAKEILRGIAENNRSSHNIGGFLENVCAIGTFRRYYEIDKEADPISWATTCTAELYKQPFRYFEEDLGPQWQVSDLTCFGNYSFESFLFPLIFSISTMLLLLTVSLFALN